MDYITFKKMASEKILDYMPEEFKDYTVKVETVWKTNRNMDGLRLMSPCTRDGMAVPVVYLEHMYRHYKGTGSISIVLEDAAQLLIAGFAEAGKTGRISFTEPEKRVIMSLVNTGQNMEMLQHVPNRQFHDLSVVYRYVVETGIGGISSVLVNNNVADMLGMDEVQLFKTAKRNTLELMGLAVKPLSEAMKEILINEGMAERDAEVFVKLPGKKNSVYVITNKAGWNGAVCMMYDAVLQKLAQKMGSDMVLLPSSVNEVLAAPAGIETPESLADMVKEVNIAAVEEEERLSDNVYYYDMGLHNLSVLAGTAYENKGLEISSCKGVH